MKPILFNTEMVRAILEGRKTVARRAIKPNQFDGECPLDVETLIDGKELMCEPWKSMTDLEIIHESYKPPYQVGDVIYVRETFGIGYDGGYIYKADDKLAGLETFKNTTKLIYKPSIHMPKEAARIFLKVTDVRVERLQDMDYMDAVYEGIDVPIDPETGYPAYNPLDDFINFWDSTIKKKDLHLYGWDANPYVWVIEFERCEKPESEEI